MFQRVRSKDFENNSDLLPATLFLKSWKIQRFKDSKIEEFEWKRARDYPENQDTSKWGKDADDKYVIELNEKLFKTFGHTLKKANTELISRGLERYLGDMSSWLS